MRASIVALTLAPAVLALAEPAAPPKLYKATEVAELASSCLTHLADKAGGIAFEAGADDVVAHGHTVTFWVKAEDSDDAGPLVTPKMSGVSPYSIELTTAGAIAVRVQGGALISEQEVMDGMWHFVAVTLQGDGVARMCFDGEVDTCETVDDVSEPDVAGGSRNTAFVAEPLAWAPPLTPKQHTVIYTSSSNRQLCPVSDGAPCHQDSDEEEEAADTHVHAHQEQDPMARPVPIATTGGSIGHGMPKIILSVPQPQHPLVAAAVAAPMPRQLLRCLHAVTVGIEVLDQDGTTSHVAKTNSVISEQIVSATSQDLTPECMQVLAGARQVIEAAGRTFDADGFASLAADASARDQHPHTHLFQLAKEDPQLLDDATQVLVMGIMAGMVASVGSLMVGLGVGCWAAASLAKAGRTKRAKDMI